MKKLSVSSRPGHITRGDVLEDLGFSAAETLEGKIKTDLWLALITHIEQRGLTQSQLVTVLKAYQPDVSNLLKGKISKVSITKLIQYAGRLNFNARVEITTPKIIKRVTGSAQSETKLARRNRVLLTV